RGGADARFGEARVQVDPFGSRAGFQKLGVDEDVAVEADVCRGLAYQLCHHGDLRAESELVRLGKQGFRVKAPLQAMFALGALAATTHSLSCPDFPHQFRGDGEAELRAEARPDRM